MGVFDYAENKKFGITEPISTKPPNEKEIKSNEAFEKYLKTISNFETIEERQKQERVLGEINKIFIDWLKSLNESEENQYEIEITAPCIYTFGSFRLGVHERGADIDTLLVGPIWVTHSMFFEDLCEKIIAKHEKVKEYSIVPEAFVPIAKFTFDDVPIDLIYAQISNEVIDDNFDIHKDEVMQAVTPQTMRSLNGPRVTDLLLDLVPDKDVFKNTVRFIKIWAKKRGVYGNVVGYLGGVAYSIMVARICQLYPKSNAATIVRQFFVLYDSWHWPTPVCLNVIKADGPGRHSVWSRDANLYDRMPIITPAYPAMNSTYNVTFSNFSFIKEELERAKLILTGTEVFTEATFKELLKDNEFFESHRHFFQITAICDVNADSNVWFGWIESRIRRFVSILEEMFYFRLVPYPKGFPVEDNKNKKKKLMFFIGSKIIVNKNEITSRKRVRQKRKINIVPVVKKFKSHVKEFGGRTKEMDISIEYISRANLPDFVKN